MSNKHFLSAEIHPGRNADSWGKRSGHFIAALGPLKFYRRDAEAQREEKESVA
jgi:hypothetical protein